MDIAIEAQPVKLITREKTQDKIVKSYLFGGISSVFFLNQYFKKKDIDGITGLVKKTIEKNNLNNKESPKKYFLNIKIINYLRIQNPVRGKKNMYICQINYVITDKFKKEILNRDFFIVYDNFFTPFSGNLKPLIIEAMVYKILNETIHTLSGKEDKFFFKYGEVLFFKKLDAAIEKIY
jgi:hypothetical protein